jgi:hypothetical protein
MHAELSPGRACKPFCALHAAIEFSSALEDLREQAAAAAAEAQELANSFAKATPLQVLYLRAQASTLALSQCQNESELLPLCL